LYEFSGGHCLFLRADQHGLSENADNLQRSQVEIFSAAVRSPVVGIPVVTTVYLAVGRYLLSVPGKSAMQNSVTSWWPAGVRSEWHAGGFSPCQGAVPFAPRGVPNLARDLLVEFASSIQRDPSSQGRTS
jgi:hypothetical protein